MFSAMTMLSFIGVSVSPLGAKAWKTSDQNTSVCSERSACAVASTDEEKDKKDKPKKKKKKLKKKDIKHKHTTIGFI